LTVLCFAGAYLTAESERWRPVHVALGYTMAGLIAFRLIWGIAGTRYARFSNFVRGPSAIISYLRSLRQGRPQHFLGHNPAGALAIIGLLGLGAAVTVTGWATLQASDGELWEEVHETFANLMLAVVILHIAAVIISSRLHHQNLLAAMIHGKKPGRPDQSATRAWPILGGIMLAAVLAFWWIRWQMS
jgi:cytochrome b